MNSLPIKATENYREKDFWRLQTRGKKRVTLEGMRGVAARRRVLWSVLGWEVPAL